LLNTSLRNIWVRTASELRIEGPRLAPLKFFRIILYPIRITPGEPLLLKLEHGFKHISLGPDIIKCIDKNGKRILIGGEKRKELASWIRIDFEVAIWAEVKSYLFFHPRYSEVLTWLRRLSLRAIDYFTSKLNILR